MHIHITTVQTLSRPTEHMCSRMSVLASRLSCVYTYIQAVVCVPS